MASAVFLNFATNLAAGSVNFNTASFKLLLVNTAPTLSQIDTWVYRSDVTTEITGAVGYTTGGVAVTLTVGSLDTVNNRLPITIGNLNPGWSSSTISAVGGILYVNTGTSTTDTLVQFVDFGGTVSSAGGDYVVSFASPIYINI